MKLIPTWTTIFGILLVFIVGCGNTDNPVGERTPEPPTEPPAHIDSPILGDWRLMDIIWLKDGVVMNQVDGAGSIAGANPNILTLAPDGIFELVQRYPIPEDELHWLEWKGWEHIQEIVVTFRGKYYIGVNQLGLNLIVTRVEPKEEGLEIRPDLEDSVFLYDFWYNDGGSLDFIHSDDGNHLELRREEGEYMVKFIHRRPKAN